MPKCEYCDKDKKYLASTSSVGSYCRECHQLVIAECQRALNELNKKYGSKIKPPRQTTGKDEQHLNALLKNASKDNTPFDTSVLFPHLSINDIPRNEGNCPHEAQARVHWLGRTCHKCAYGRGTPCSYPVHKDKET